MEQYTRESGPDRRWRLNFNGLTRVVATLWPFAAIGFLIHLAARRRDSGVG